MKLKELLKKRTDLSLEIEALKHKECIKNDFTRLSEEEFAKEREAYKLRKEKQKKYDFYNKLIQEMNKKK